MRSGYKVFWSDNALIELADTYDYLEENFSVKELNKLSHELERVLNLISKNPSMFPLSSNLGVRRVVIKKYNTLYYRQSKNHIEVLSFFSNRKNPRKIKI